MKYYPQLAIAPFVMVFVMSGALSEAQTSTSLNLTITTNENAAVQTGRNAFVWSQTGAVNPLGNATLVSAGSVWAMDANGNPEGPVQLSFVLYFNQVDTISLSFTESDPNFSTGSGFNLANGTITGGTGAYAGATGSLNLTVAYVGASNVSYVPNAATTGSGTLIVGGKTTALTLSNFKGGGGGVFFKANSTDDEFANPNGYTLTTGNITATGSLGNATGSFSTYGGPSTEVKTVGTINMVLSATDSLMLWFNYTNTATGGAPPSFTGNIAGGTGKYAQASGALNFTTPTSGGGTLGVTGSMTMTPANGPVITSVQTANGLSQLATNTWLAIKGTNLVPASTPAGGANWSNAPDFANGQMPTQLGGISVMVNGSPAYIYFYCSAVTDPSCSSDQINVLAPLLGSGTISSPATVTVTNNGVTSAPFLALKTLSSQAFLTFDLVGHVAAVHLDGTLVGPASLYPGASTPAKAGETISVYGVGFGNITSGTIVAGSATQAGPLASVFCWVGGVTANTVGALISPGLYQFNITIPNAVPSGDNLLNCLYNVQPTYGGALIAVQ